jgi:predicted acylesterase/phospholipase RssA
MSEPAARASSSKRRGLVLAGGGARGAYAFGCMIALKRLGYEFKAVSGTSVGALNAALWSTGSLAEGFGLWKELSFKSVYPVRMRSFGLPRMLVWTIASVYVSLHLIGATGRGHKTPATVVLAPLVALAYAGLCLALFAYLSSPYFEASELRWEFVLVITLAYSVMLYSSLVRFSERAAEYFLLGIYIAVCGTWLTSLMIHGWPSFLIGIAMVFVLAFPFVMMFAGVGQGLSWIFRIFSAATIFSTTPLRKRIDAILSGAGWKSRTFVTSARSADLLELAKPVEWALYKHLVRYMPLLRRLLGNLFHRADLGVDTTLNWVVCPESKHVFRPAVVKSWIPAYTDISFLPPDEAADYLMASAALPFGLTSPVSMGVQAEGFKGRDWPRVEHVFVDGGVVDNVPWLPLLQLGLDELIIVLLEPFPDDSSAFSSLDMTVEKWIRHRLLTALEDLPRQRHMDFDIYNADRWMVNHLEKRHAKFQREAASFELPDTRMIYPRSSLGGFIAGTLRFDGRYAKELIRLGIQDTYRAAGEWASSS